VCRRGRVGRWVRDSMHRFTCVVSECHNKPAFQENDMAREFYSRLLELK
jgi:hypothetical protein